MHADLIRTSIQKQQFFSQLKQQDETMPADEGLGSEDFSSPHMQAKEAISVFERIVSNNSLLS